MRSCGNEAEFAADLIKESGDLGLFCSARRGTGLHVMILSIVFDVRPVVISTI